MKLGIWWLEAAARGGPARLPIVNVKPTFEGDVKAGGAGSSSASERGLVAC